MSKVNSQIELEILTKLKDANANINSLINKMSQLEKSQEKVKKSGEGMSSSLGSIGKVAGIAAVAVGLGAIGAAAIKGAASMETYKTSFDVLLGSADKSKELMADLKKFGAETPFEFPELAESTKKLLAFGVAQEDILPKLKAIGDISSGVGAPISEISELFGKARVQGTLYAEDINQLVGRGIPVIQEFAKQLGVSEGEVKKMASEGKITFDMLDKAFTDLTSNGGQFAGMMDAQSKTFDGMMSTLKDALGEVALSIGNSLMPFLKQLIGIFNQLLPILTPIIDQFIKFFAPILEDIGNNIIILLKPLGKLVSTLLSGLQPVIGIVLKGFNRLIPALVKIIEAVDKWLVAMKPLADVYMKILTEQMDNFIPLIDSLASILINLTPLINLMAKGLAETLKFIAWANNGLMSVFVATLEAASWVVEKIVDGLAAMGIVEKTVTKSTREVGDATYEATQNMMGMGKGFNITADAAKQQGIMVATTAGAVNTLTQKTDANTTATNKNNGSNKDFLKTLKERDDLTRKMNDHYTDLNSSMNTMFGDMEKERKELEKVNKERAVELKQIQDKYKIENVGAPPKSKKEQQYETEEQKIADDGIKELEAQAERAKKAYEIIGEAASAAGQLIGAGLVGADVGFKETLKPILTALIGFVQAEFLAAQAAMAIKALFTSGVSLTTDAAFAAVAYGALEIAKGAVNSFDKGIDYVPYDQLAYIHEGERVLTKDENKDFMSGGNKNTGSLIKRDKRVMNGNIQVSISNFNSVRRKQTFQISRGTA